MAEQLSQLPNDMDVENMVEATYGVVLDHKLDKGESAARGWLAGLGGRKVT